MARALVKGAGLVLLVVFLLKAAILPLHFWLTRAYAAAPAPVAALFAIMTKVGIYGIIRFFTLVFPADSVIERLAADILLPEVLESIGEWGPEPLPEPPEVSETVENRRLVNRVRRLIASS